MCFNALYSTLLGDLNQTSLSSLQLLRGNFPSPPNLGMFGNKSSTLRWKLYTLHLAIIAWVFKSPADQYGEEAGDRAYSLSSSSEKKTRMSLEPFADVLAKVEHSLE